jgi:TctA family transporter
MTSFDFSSDDLAIVLMRGVYVAGFSSASDAVYGLFHLYICGRTLSGVSYWFIHALHFAE